MWRRFGKTTLNSFQCGIQGTVRYVCSRLWIIGDNGIYQLALETDQWLHRAACHLVLYTNQFDMPDRKSTRLNSSHVSISYAVFCLKKKNHLIRLVFASVH